MLPILQRTPLPLETATPKLSLNQVTDIPTLPPVTATPTLSLQDSVLTEYRRRGTDRRNLFLHPVHRHHRKLHIVALAQVCRSRLSSG